MINLKGEDYKLLYDLPIDREYILELKEIKRGQKISILSDTMLKTMFQNSNRLKYSAKFLSCFLDIPYEELLQNIYLGKNELDKDKENEKSERCDYVANIKDTSLNIEVNNNSSVKIMERNMEYAYRLYAQKIKAKNKEYDYTQVIQFNLNNFAFKGNDKIIDIYTIQNEKGLRLNNKLIFVQIYVPNLRKKWYTKGVESLTKEEKCILALTEMDLEKLKELGVDKIMEEYVKEAEEVSFEDDIKESYDKEWALKDQGYRDGTEDGYKNGLEHGLEQGVEKGIKQGKREEKIEIAKKMLDKNIDIESICECTDLSLKEVESLNKKLNSFPVFEI